MLFWETDKALLLPVSPPSISDLAAPLNRVHFYSLPISEFRGEICQVVHKIHVHDMIRSRIIRNQNVIIVVACWSRPTQRSLTLRQSCIGQTF